MHSCKLINAIPLRPQTLLKVGVLVHKAPAITGKWSSLTTTCGEAVFMFQAHDTKIIMEQPLNYTKTHPQETSLSLLNIEKFVKLIKHWKQEYLLFSISSVRARMSS